MNRSFYVDIDLALDTHDTRRVLPNGRLVLQGPVLEDLQQRKLYGQIIDECGPGGGNPVVRVYGAKHRLAALLETYDEDWRDLYQIVPNPRARTPAE